MKRTLSLLFALAPLILFGETNVLVITMDTLRADRLMSYGYQKPTSPFLKSLADEGVLFEHAEVPAPSTLPSHASLFTGLYPYSTQVRHNLIHSLPAEIPTLATMLKSRGYHTSAIIGSSILHKRFGLDQGFDTYDQTMPESKNERTADVVTDAAIAALAKTKSPFFLWVHYYDVHHPYEPPPPYDTAFDNPYDGEIAFMDAQIKRLVLSMDEKVLTNTLIILVSDHGEGLGDHNEDEHGVLLYESTTHVPLIIYQKNRFKPLQISSTVTITALTPSILESLDILEDKPAFDAPSFWPAVRGETLPGNWFYMETYLAFYSFNWAPIRGVTNGQWKYLESPEEELFDLRVDPGETSNLIEKRPAIASRLKLRLKEISPEAYGQIAEIHRVEIPEDELKKLQSLGYLSGSQKTHPNPIELPDPKDLVDISNKLLIQAPELTRSGEFTRLQEMMMNILRRDRRNLLAMKYLATAYLSENNLDEAQRTLERADSLSPDTTFILTKLGIVHYKKGRLKKGLSFLERSYELNPYGAEAIGYYAQALVQAGQQSKAETVLEFAEENKLMNSAAMVARGLLHLKRKELVQAGKAFEKATELDETDASAYANLGYIYHLQGKTDESIRALVKSLELEPENRKILKALIGSLLSIRRTDEARPHMEDYLKYFPDSPDAAFVREELEKISRK